MRRAMAVNFPPNSRTSPGRRSSAIRFRIRRANSSESRRAQTRSASGLQLYQRNRHRLPDTRGYRHPLRIRAWSREDDPATGPQPPIVAHKWQPTRNNLLRLKLRSGAERSYMLRRVRFAARAGHRITLIFPVVEARSIPFTTMRRSARSTTDERPEVEHYPCGGSSRVGPDPFI